MGKRFLVFVFFSVLLGSINDLSAQVSGDDVSQSATATVLRATIVVNASSSGSAYIVIIETVSNSEPDATIEYSMDGVNYQTSPVFTDVSPGEYLIYVRDEAGQIGVKKLSLSEVTEGQ